MQPQNHYLDKFAGLLAEQGQGDGDDLLTTKEMQAWWKSSESWFEKARAGGYGPPYIKISKNQIRYPRSGAIAYLLERARIGVNRLYRRAAQ